MAKDKTLFKEVMDIFDGYHPLAVFNKGTLFINQGTIKDKDSLSDKADRLNNLIKTGPECWQLQSVVLGDYPVLVPVQRVGSLELK